MPVLPLASVAALEARLGLEAGALADDAAAIRALADASALVGAEVASRVVWTPSTLPPVVETVLLDLAARRFALDPGGASSVSVGEVSTRYADDVSPYLTPAEAAIVKRAAGLRTAHGFTGSVPTPSAYGEPGWPSPYAFPGAPASGEPSPRWTRYV